jgi:predicted nucleic acid-binding protein
VRLASGPRAAPRCETVTRFVIDPPTLVRLVTDAAVVPEGHRLVAPNALRSAALEILMARVREGSLDERDALVLHEKMTELKIRLLGDRVSRRSAWHLAMTHGWEDLGDAEYVAVTQLQADKLVAGDARLVARASGLVIVAPFDELVGR